MLFLDLGATILGVFRDIGMHIINFIYTIIASLYNFFITLTKVQLFGDPADPNNVIQEIYNRVQVILAVIMVFYVTLEFIKYIINPDTFSDKEKGGSGLIKRIVIVIVLMAFTPKLFSIAYDLQSRIITSDVIPKVLIKDYDEKEYDNSGGAFSRNLLSLFYQPYKAYEKDSNGNKHEVTFQCKDKYTGIFNAKCSCNGKDTVQESIDIQLGQLEKNGTMSEPTYCISNTANNDIKFSDGSTKKNPFLIDVNWVLAILVGGFMIWMLFLYCMEAGRVVIQFAFLQIIAPIPIISYIAPGKDGMFNKWLKQCVTTYLDLFIRLFIMYLVMMVSQFILKLWDDGGVKLISGEKLDTATFIWIIIFLIIGLCLFALKAPKMIQELLPNSGGAASGNFGMSGKDNPFAAKTLSAVGGAAGRTARRTAKHLGAGLGAGIRGVKKGAKKAGKTFFNARRRKREDGIGYKEQVGGWAKNKKQEVQDKYDQFRDRQDQRREAKDARKQAKNNLEEARKNRNSAAGQLIRADQELQDVNKRKEQLENKANRTNAEERELARLKSRSTELTTKIQEMKQRIAAGEITANQQIMLNAYNASKAYEQAKNKLELTAKGTPEYAAAQQELKLREQELRTAGGQYTKSTIDSLFDAQEKAASAQATINAASEKIKQGAQASEAARKEAQDRYDKMTDVEKNSPEGQALLQQIESQTIEGMQRSYDGYSDKESEPAKQLKEIIEYKQALKEKTEADQQIEKVQKQIQEINSGKISESIIKQVEEATTGYKTSIEEVQKIGSVGKTFGNAVGNVASSVASTFGEYVGDVTGGAWYGLKNTKEVKNFGEVFKKNLEAAATEERQAAEFEAQYKRRATIVDKVKIKYDNFLQKYGFENTLTRINNDLIKTNTEVKYVKEAASATNGVFNEMENIKKIAKELITNRKATQKFIGTVMAGDTQYYLDGTRTISEFYYDRDNELKTIEGKIQQQQQTLANLESQLLNAPASQRGIFEEKIAQVNNEVEKLTHERNEKSGALGDLLKNLGKKVEELAFRGELGEGFDDAQILAIPQKMKDAFKLLKRDTITMNQLKEKMEKEMYITLDTLNIETATHKDFTDLKAALETAGINLSQYEKELTFEANTIQAKKDEIEKYQKLGDIGSSGGSK